MLSKNQPELAQQKPVPTVSIGPLRLWWILLATRVGDVPLKEAVKTLFWADRLPKRWYEDFKEKTTAFRRTPTSWPV
ncbi:hypothetical protein D3C86_1354350 [compost metagenome]